MFKVFIFPNHLEVIIICVLLQIIHEISSIHLFFETLRDVLQY